MIVLGIDPGLANTGFGVVARRGGRMAALDGGVVRTRPSSAPERRLLEIHTALAEVVARWRPDAVALEELYFGQNVSSAVGVGQARGVAMLAASQSGVSCHGYTPQQVKGAVCGSGRADKAQVIRMVRGMLGLGEEQALPDHAADALAVAICHVSSSPLLAAKARAGALA